ncbi:MAG: SDR family NAD(P)-dependent oxidoreductase [Pseudomonadales bacterium]|nr:SDR family NAD(P)-dependent oxidoreductase [Pseudomonadales bacterium]
MTTPPSVYWITGAGSGIGLALARALARRGDHVIASGRRPEALAALQQEFPDNMTPLPVDVTDKVAMEDLFGRPEVAHLKRLDGVILSAGICEYVHVDNLDPTLFERVMQTNFQGAVLSTRAALPLLRQSAASASRPAVLAAVSSMSTYVGFPRAQAYGASKAALSYFLDSLRCDLAPGISVCTIYPGFIETPMTEQNDFPMPMMLSAEQAAHRILSALEKRPRRIVLPWRMHALLTLARALPGIWYGMAIPRLTRQRRVAP